MWKPIYQPEPWPQFRKRKDIAPLPLMEQRKKYMQEQILFENYLSTLNTVNTVSTAAAGAAGGPAPGGSTPEVPIIVKIDTNYNWQPGDWGTRNTEMDATTKVFVAAGAGVSSNSVFYTPFEVTVDWGDGTIETYNSTNYALDGDFGTRTSGITHSYAADGEYDITFSGFSRFDLKFGALPIVDLTSYPINGDIRYFNFEDKQNFPNLVNRFSYVNWSGYNPPAGKSISDWDVSKIKAFNFAFSGYSSWQGKNFYSSSFVYPIPNVENWDVSSGTEFRGMFQGQVNFSQSLASWDVSNSIGFNYMFRDCYNLVSGARADLWDTGEALSNPLWYDSFWATFKDSMKEPSAIGSMPHVGNWNISGITPGISNLFYQCWDGSGFSHAAIGETLIGWASQSVVPINVGIASSAFSNTFTGTYTTLPSKPPLNIPNFGNPSYDTGSAFGLEVSASYAFLTGTAADGSTTTLTVTAITAKGDTERFYVNNYPLSNTELIDDFTFLIGNTYRFDQSDASNAGHPLRFSTTIDGIHGGGNEYTTGVTIVGTPGTSGSYSEITVTENTASPLYVYCPNHAGYGLGSFGGNPKPLTMNEGGKGWTIPGFTFD